MTNSQKRALQGAVGGIGLIFLLIGAMSDLYSTTTGVIIALAIWIIGIPLLHVVGLGARKKGEEQKIEEQSSEAPQASEGENQEQKPE